MLCLKEAQHLDVRKWMTIFGIAVFCSVNGVATFYGNLLTYTNSYLLVKRHHDVTHTSATILSAWAITFSLAIMFSQKVTKRLKKYQSLLLGMVVFEASILVGYWDINGPVPVFIITHGLLAGLATGFLLAVVSEYLIELTNGKNLGLISSFATTNTTGSLLINQLITIYINPENLPPDISVGRTTYFQQEQVLDRVPSIFLILAGVFTAIHLIGFALIREPRKNPKDESAEAPNTQGVHFQMEDNRDEDSKARDGLLEKNRGNGCVESPHHSNHNGHRYYTDLQHPSLSGVSDSTNEDNTVRGNLNNETKASSNNGGVDMWNGVRRFRGTETDTVKTKHLFGDEFHTSLKQQTEGRDYSTRMDFNIVPSPNGKSTTCLEVEEAGGLFEYSDKTGELYDEKIEGIDLNVPKTEHSPAGPCMTWKEGLRTREFYLIWFATGSAEMAYLVTSTFYKSFGQSLIQDDHFMGTVGTIMCGVLFFSRLFWGIVMDKVKLKESLVIYFASLSVFGIGWFFSPYVDRWFFLIWNSLLAACAGGMFSVLYYAVYACFGGENFNTMYGLSLSSTILVSIVLPSVSSALLEHFSWPGLFFCMASMNVLALLLIVIFFPRKV